MNHELEIQKIRLQAYHERYTALTILSLQLSSRPENDKESRKLTSKTLETLNFLRKETLEQITLTESYIRSLK